MAMILNFHESKMRLKHFLKPDLMQIFLAQNPLELIDDFVILLMSMSIFNFIKNA